MMINRVPMSAYVALAALTLSLHSPVPSQAAPPSDTAATATQDDPAPSAPTKAKKKKVSKKKAAKKVASKKVASKKSDQYLRTVTPESTDSAGAKPSRSSTAQRRA